MRKLACATCLILSSLATNDTNAVTAKNGLYVDANAGYVWQAFTPNPNGGTDGSQRRFAYGADIGYEFALTPNFLLGPEFGYGHDGETDGFFSGRTISVKTSDWHLLAKGTYLMDTGFNLFGKAGYTKLHNDYTNGIPHGYGSENKNYYRPEVAIGAGYLMDMAGGNSVNTFVEYDHIFAKDGRTHLVSDTQVFTIDVVKLGIAYKFNM